MKTCAGIFFTLCLLCAVGAIGAVNSTTKFENNPSAGVLTVGKFLSMDAKAFAIHYGTKLSLRERIVFGFVKKQLKRSVRKGTLSLDATAADAAEKAEGSLNVGAFFLCFFLVFLD